MDKTKKIYRGLIIRTTTRLPYLFIQREISVYIAKYATDISKVRETRFFRSQTIGNDALIARVNSPNSGIVIVLNIRDEETADLEVTCERLRAALFLAIHTYSQDLDLGASSPKEESWLEQRYLDIYEECSDLLRYELSGREYT